MSEDPLLAHRNEMEHTRGGVVEEAVGQNPGAGEHHPAPTAQGNVLDQVSHFVNSAMQRSTKDQRLNKYRPELELHLAGKYTAQPHDGPGGGGWTPQIQMRLNRKERQFDFVRMLGTATPYCCSCLPRFLRSFWWSFLGGPLVARFKGEPMPLNTIASFEIFNLWNRHNNVSTVYLDVNTAAELSNDENTTMLNELFVGQRKVKLLSDIPAGDWAKPLTEPTVFIFRNPRVFRDAMRMIHVSLSNSVVVNATGIDAQSYFELEVPHKDLLPAVRLVLASNILLWDVSNVALTRRKLYQKRIVDPRSWNYMAVTLAFIVMFLGATCATLLTANGPGTCEMSHGIRNIAADPINPFLDSGIMVALLLQTLVCYHLFYNSATSTDPSVNTPKYSDTISDLFKEDKVVMLVLYSILLVYSNIVRSKYVDAAYMSYFIRICFVQLFCINATFTFSVSGNPFKSTIHFAFVTVFCIMTLFTIMLTGSASDDEFTCRLMALLITFILAFFVMQIALVFAKEDSKEFLICLSFASETMIIFMPFFVTDEEQDPLNAIGTAFIACAAVVLAVDVLILIPGFRGSLDFVKSEVPSTIWAGGIPNAVQDDDTHRAPPDGTAEGATTGASSSVVGEVTMVNT